MPMVRNSKDNIKLSKKAKRGFNPGQCKKLCFGKKNVNLTNILTSILSGEET